MIGSFIRSCIIYVGLLVTIESGKGVFLSRNMLVNVFLIFGIWYFEHSIYQKIKKIKLSFLNYFLSGVYAIGTFFSSIYTRAALDYHFSPNNYKSIVDIFPEDLSSLEYISEVCLLGIYFCALLFIINIFQRGILYYKLNPNLVDNYVKMNNSGLLSGINKIFDKKPFLFSFVLLATPLVLFSLTTYPGLFMGDTLDQISQYLGLMERRANHPVASTFLVGSLVELGIRLGNIKIGIFLYTLLQIFLFSFSVGYSIKLFYKVTNKKLCSYIILLIMMLSPSIWTQINIVTKDINYASFFLIFIMTLTTYHINKEVFFKFKGQYLFFISIMLLILFRHNSIYFLAPTLVLYLIIYLSRDKAYIRASILSIVTICFSVLLNNVLVENFVETQDKPLRREMMSVPFQHTARQIVFNEEDITPKDKEIIDRVLDYDVIKKVYNPGISDSVKRTHKEEASSEEMKAYYKLSLRQAKQHPLTALESYLTLHGSAFSFNYISKQFQNNHLEAKYKKQIHKDITNKLNLHEDAAIVEKLENRNYLVREVDTIPFLGLIGSYGFNLFLLLLMFVYYLNNLQFKKVVLILPILLLAGTILMGPVSIGYMRYWLPINMVTPFVLFYFIFAKDNKLNDKLGMMKNEY